MATVALNATVGSYGYTAILGQTLLGGLELGSDGSGEAQASISWTITRSGTLDAATTTGSATIGTIVQRSGAGDAGGVFYGTSQQPRKPQLSDTPARWNVAIYHPVATTTTLALEADLTASEDAEFAELIALALI